MGLDRLWPAIKDVWDFERSNLKGIFDKAKKDPERLFLGAGDPLTSKVWGGVTGKDYEPAINEWGGATEESYAKAEAEGINTGPGRGMHDVAQAIAAYQAGGYGFEQAAAAMPAMPEIPTGWAENIPEGVKPFVPGTSGQIMTPEQAGQFGGIYSGAASAGYSIDEAEERSDPGPWPLPEGTYVPGDVSPNYQSFMDKYGGGGQSEAPVGGGPPTAPAAPAAPPSGPPSGLPAGPSGGSYGSFMERYGQGRMPETRHQPGRPGTPVGAPPPQPAFSYNPNPPAGWV